MHLGGKGKKNVTSERSARVSFVGEELIKCAIVWCGTGVPGQPEASRCAVSVSVNRHNVLSCTLFIQPSKLESMARKKEHLRVHSGSPDTLQKPRNLLHLGQWRKTILPPKPYRTLALRHTLPKACTSQVTRSSILYNIFCSFVYPFLLLTAYLLCFFLHGPIWS